MCYPSATLARLLTFFKNCEPSSLLLFWTITQDIKSLPRITNTQAADVERLANISIMCVSGPVFSSTFSMLSAQGAIGWPGFLRPVVGHHSAKGLLQRPSSCLAWFPTQLHLRSKRSPTSKTFIRCQISCGSHGALHGSFLSGVNFLRNELQKTSFLNVI